MIDGIDVGSRGYRALKAWLEDKQADAQSLINNNASSDEETRYQRGRRDLATMLLEEMKPETPALPVKKRPRDASGHR